MELDFIQWLREQSPASAALNYDDDAAALMAPNSVITTDMILEGVHFLPCLPLADVGRKAFAVNLSDLAAMAARPQGAVCSLAIPRRHGPETQHVIETAKQLVGGMLELSREFETPIVGGDTNVWDGPLAVNVTVWGEPPHGMLRRSGGQPGDRLLVTGPLGGSLQSKHHAFQPRVREALELKRLFPLKAGMDTTDGLAVDVTRLAKASGCGAVLDLDSVPKSPDVLAETEAAALRHALEDGEDFELVFAAEPAVATRILAEYRSHPILAQLDIHDVGFLCEENGLYGVRSNGQRHPLPVGGYLHGA